MEEQTSNQEQLPEIDHRMYPSLLSRVQAVFVDSLFLIAAAYLVFAGLDSVTSDVPTLKAVLFVIIFLLYEPILLSAFGWTIGHKAVSIKVRKASDHNQKINFFLALLRFVLKSALGWVSLIVVTFNQEKRAIHDFASNSVVLADDKK